VGSATQLVGRLTFTVVASIRTAAFWSRCHMLDTPAALPSANSSVRQPRLSADGSSGLPAHASSSTTVFVTAPSFSISTVTTSPALSHTGGLRKQPTPGGVLHTRDTFERTHVGCTLGSNAAASQKNKRQAADERDAGRASALAVLDRTPCPSDKSLSANHEEASAPPRPADAPCQNEVARPQRHEA